MLAVLEEKIDSSYTGKIEVKIKVTDSEETTKPVSTVIFNGYSELLGHGDFDLGRDVDTNIEGFAGGAGHAVIEIKYDMDGDGNVDGSTMVKTAGDAITIK